MCIRDSVCILRVSLPTPRLLAPCRAALYEDEDHNVNGDAALYTPGVKVDAAGASNSKLSIVMPKSGGPRGASDFVDCMWFRDASNGKIIAAESFGPNGLSRDFSLRADTGEEPTFAARVKSGLTVVPSIHASKGGTWEGTPFKVK